MKNLKKLTFLKAKAICPPDAGPWSESCEQSLYWMAHKRIKVDVRMLAENCWRAAADRHYLLYINGERVVRQLGYFSGDQYLFGQEYGSELTRYLRPGENDIVALVRSDPWPCKNYRPFQPAFWLEALDKDGTPWLFTDETWETSSLSGWRDHLFLSTTQLYEQVHLATIAQSGEGGAPHTLTAFQPAAGLKSEKGIPEIYVWTDPPKETVIRTPRVLASGRCRLSKQAIHFDLADAFSGGARDVKKKKSPRTSIILRGSASSARTPTLPNYFLMLDLQTGVTASSLSTKV